MYVTTPWNHAYAIDCKTGSQLWHYQKSLPENLALCCDAVNRGFAAWGDRLYMATLDAHLVCLDRNTGEEIWDTADHRPRRRRQGGRRHLQDGLQRHRRPAGDQGQGHHRHQRRRVRHPRLHRRLRRQDRQAALAVLHRPQRRRQVGARPQGPGDLGGQLLADRRRLGLGHRHLRPRAQHPLLGRRQPLARLQRRGPQGGQPLHLLDPGPQPRRRLVQVALPEQPPRRLGLRRRERARPGRHQPRRQADQGAGPGAPQRLLLLPEPRDRRVPLRQAVLRGHLDRPHQGGRRPRPEDGPAVRQPGRAADRGGRPRLPRRGRRQGMEPDGLRPGHRARLSCR